MKKKLLLIFFIVLIVVFLIIFINRTSLINEQVNNTINNTNEYKIKLTLTNDYVNENNIGSTKIIYIEEKKNNLYRFSEILYENGTLIRENISYLDKNKYYYKEKNNYIIKEINDVNDVKKFKINYTGFFSKIKKLTRTKVSVDKEYFKTKMKSEDAFSLIYDNSKNNDLEKYTTINLVANKNDIEEVSFRVKDKSNTYSVKLNLDFGLQDIKLDIK